MTSVRLATFVQVSDLHFGDIDMETGEVAYDRSIATLWKLLPALRGLAGHEPYALRDLSLFFEERRKEDPKLALLVTGDLTSTGKKSQFTTVEEFLGGELEPPKGNDIGLNVRGWKTGAIPGNHDHWPGRYFFLGPPKSHLLEWAKVFPLIREADWPLGDTGVRLRFLAVNTDADVGSWGPERVLARGSCQTQLRRLRDQLEALGPAAENEIRVLLLHHSLAYEAPPKGLPAGLPARLARVLRHGLFRRSMLGELELNRASRELLRQMVARLQISVILTGHTHEPMIACFTAHSRNPPRWISFMEACCGTTTQANVVPRKLDPHSAGDPLLDANALVLHQLFLERGRIVWQAETWTRRPMRSSFFKAEGRPHEKLQAAMVVWPRP